MPNDDVMGFCVYAYLEYVRGLRKSIDAVQEDLERLESAADAVGLKLSDMPRAHELPDGLFSSVAAIAGARERLLMELFRYSSDYLDAAQMCRPLYAERWAVWLHYIQGRTWKQVANMLRYSESWTRELAKRGVAEIYQQMPEDWRREPIPNAVPWPEE